MDASSPLENVRAPEPCSIVIFGGRGDLATRKLLPALAGLALGGYLPAQFLIVGVGRRPATDDEYRNEVAEAIRAHRQPPPAPEQLTSFLSHVHYHAADASDRADIERLGTALAALEKEAGLPGNRVFYLAVDPDYFEAIADHLAKAGLCRRDRVQPWSRVVFEKPFGHDLASARKLNAKLLDLLREDQICRIDHYLGKETVQNLLAFRFGNAVFEPLFNRNLVDHVQITVAETVGMEGRRGAYYDGSGALRDVLQNHILQVLALVAMEAPASLKADDLRDAKMRVLRDLAPLTGDAVGRNVVRGQYGKGVVEGKAAPAYREEFGVAADSTTETYVAVRAEIESWRWAGVPFLLRTGKRLPRRLTEVAVHFKQPPLRLFRTVECEGDVCDLTEAQPNVLVFRIQPDEGICLAFSVKRPGMQIDLHSASLEFSYGRSFNKALPEAYERLLFDVIRGDATLLMRTDEVEAAWEFVTPILEAWKRETPPRVAPYSAGTWGPADAEKLLCGCACVWRNPS